MLETRPYTRSEACPSVGLWVCGSVSNAFAFRLTRSVYTALFRAFRPTRSDGVMNTTLFILPNRKNTLLIRRVCTRHPITILKKDLESAERENSCLRRSWTVRALCSGDNRSKSVGEKSVIGAQFFPLKNSPHGCNMLI